MSRRGPASRDDRRCADTLPRVEQGDPPCEDSTTAESLLEAFLVSTGVVALGEMGDKTQLLANVLAAMFRKPAPIILGIFVATLVNHAAAGAVGGWAAQALGPDLLRWVIGASLLAMAGWMLIPDQLDDDAVERTPRFGKECTDAEVHGIAAVIFAVLGVLTFFNVGSFF